MKEQKTNVIRILEQKKIPCVMRTYEHDGTDAIGIAAAGLTGQPVEKVFKTLVTRGASKTNYVFVIPVAQELDLKKAAKAAGEKSVEMIHVSEINALTGYVRGGCSPIGMKKLFKTFIDISAEAMDTINVSGGKIGLQIELKPGDLAAVVNGRFAELTIER